MGKAMEAMNGASDSVVEVIREEVGQGVKGILVRTKDGAVTYEVFARDREASPWTVLKATPHKDVAEQVYESFDGRFRPWADHWQPRGFNDMDVKGKTLTVIAVGSTVQDCLDAFADSLGSENTADVQDLRATDNGVWQARFTVDGTSFKGHGLRVPGGAVMTHWQ